MLLKIKLTIKNLLNPLWTIPVRSYNNIIINIFGFQVFRLIIENLKINIRSLFYKENLYLKKQDLLFLKKNGYLIINNFFNKKDFLKFKSCIKFLRKNKLFNSRKDGTINVDLANLSIIKKKNIKMYNQILSLIKSRNFTMFAEYIIKKKINFISDPGFYVTSLHSNKDKNDNNSEFHSDKHFPCCKIFLYINESKKENGAFTYVPGSHRLNMQKIKFEYFYSIFSSTKLFDKYLNFFGFVRKNKRLTLNDDILKKYYDKLKVCSAKENSLVIFNNMGLHKRGKILVKNKERQIFAFSFYDNQVNNLMQKFKRSIFNKNKRLFLQLNKIN